MYQAHRLNLRQVEAFRAVMLTGQITAAAELMFITQPAVSRLIADFERATSLHLFERRGNRLLPTSAAFTLMREVQSAFVGLDRIGRAAQDIGRNFAGTLRIFAMPALANGTLARFVGRFVRGREGLHVSLEAASSPVVIEKVASGDAELGYVDFQFDRAGMLCRHRSVDAVVALPSDHPLNEKKVLSRSDLIGENLIEVQPGSIFSKRLSLELEGIDRTSMIETNHSLTACSMVLEGAGIAIIDHFAASEFLARGLSIRRFEPSLEAGFTELSAVESRQDVLTAEFANGFWSFLQQELIFPV
ncbi:LysR substrate-binding domain-containing protein [Pantoea sp. YR343]|uniref:LysR substrate-binding domain-containing protein n=1 Tax=Pantoea sp. YR343 TaxID=1144341 RepID=UPI0002711509|nr:LysR substrate-binding domain-containing protein [Pantoea sp. YR343]KAJ9431813.1 LysR substrate-binding domain-containing protein [Pantoea sp. YR343]